MSSARWLLVVTSSSLALIAPRVARACSPQVCSPAAFLPEDDARVPANAPGLLWLPLSDARTNSEADPAQVSLTRAADPGTALPFTARPSDQRRAFLLVPDAQLTVGESYVVSDAAACEGRMPASTRFVAGPAAALPTSLGTLSASAQVVKTLSVGTSSGSCVSDVKAAQRSIDLALDAGAAPWGDLLELETLVDGESWSSSATLIRSNVDNHTVGVRVLVHHTCSTSDDGADQGLYAGSHEVQMRAVLAGTTTTLASTTLRFSLDCTTSKPPRGGQPDEPPVDASDRVDAAGCNAGGAGAGSLAWLGLALVAVRRRARPTAS